MSSSIKKILVVEDTSLTRFSVKRLLEEHGYEVAEAASGEEALTRLAALESEAKWDFGVATYPDNGTDPASLYGHAQAILRAHEPKEDRQPAPGAQPAGTCSPDKPGEERGQAKGNGDE